MRTVIPITLLCSLSSAGPDHLGQWDVFTPAVFGPAKALDRALSALHTPALSCDVEGNHTDPVCVYTSRSFASGRGISIVTTIESLQYIERLPAISNSAIHRLSKANQQISNPSFEERELPGRGKGLIANRTLHRGDRIFAHTPILIFHEDASQNLKDDVWAGLENDAVGGLPTPAKAMFWNLFGQPSHSPAGGRINTNAFSIDIEDTEHYAVFPEIARLNHDCRPNAAYFFDEATLTHYVHAITDIHPGTELTITYIDPHMQREDRMRTLFDTWGFNCSCSTCSLAAQLSRASDARLDEIEEILEDFDEDEEIMSSTMALTLISLYEQERLYGPLAEAYRFAATAFCAEGDVWNTVKYANLAIEIGMLENGFDSENLESLRRLSDDPEEQPCWSLEKSADIEP